MELRKIYKVYPPHPPHELGSGLSAHYFLPDDSLSEKMNPFYLLGHAERIHLQPSEETEEVGTHPHRGLETVTILYEGKLLHSDSLGNNSKMNSGDVVWLTTGSGVQHNLSVDKNHTQKGENVQIGQIWISLPQEHKMATPRSQFIKNKDIPKVQLQNKAGRIEVIAGEYQNIKSQISTFSPINVYSIFLEKNGTVSLTFPENYNTGLVVTKGLISINDEATAPKFHFIVFENEGEEISLRAEESSTLLIFSGKPLNESWVAHGPFLMNSHAEIHKAYDDYNNGFFGYTNENYEGERIKNI